MPNNFLVNPAQKNPVAASERPSHQNAISWRDLGAFCNVIDGVIHWPTVPCVSGAVGAKTGLLSAPSPRSSAGENLESHPHHLSRTGQSQRQCRDASCCLILVHSTSENYHHIGARGSKWSQES